MKGRRDGMKGAKTQRILRTEYIIRLYVVDYSLFLFRFRSKVLRTEYSVVTDDTV